MWYVQLVEIGYQNSMIDLIECFNEVSVQNIQLTMMFVHKMCEFHEVFYDRAIYEESELL